MPEETIQSLLLPCECISSPQDHPALWGASPGSARDPDEKDIKAGYRGCAACEPFVGSQTTLAAHALCSCSPQNVTVTRSALCTIDATRQASASAGRAQWGPSATTAFPRTTGAKDAIVSRLDPLGWGRGPTWREGPTWPAAGWG